ncbi:MAG: DUF2237 domain-containing protein [Planctomycetota bacterium]
MSEQNGVAKKNVLGGPLQPCCFDPLTGYFRDGYCRTDAGDHGRHIVCAQVTAEFLEFTKQRGNNLSSPAPEYGFPGLEPGDRWCLCVLRWKEAMEHGAAPPIVLEACDEATLSVVPIETLREYAL